MSMRKNTDLQEKSKNSCAISNYLTAIGVENVDYKK